MEEADNTKNMVEYLWTDSYNNIQGFLDTQTFWNPIDYFVLKTW